jgi:hypothetical protein
MTPYENDSTLTPQYLEVMTTCFTAMVTLAQDSLDAAYIDLPKMVSDFFCKIYKLYDSATTIKAVILQKSTVLLCSLITSCVNNNMVVKAQSGQSELGTMLQLVESSLSDISYRDNWGYILLLSESIFEVRSPNTASRPHSTRSNLQNPFVNHGIQR